MRQLKSIQRLYVKKVFFSEILLSSWWAEGAFVRSFHSLKDWSEKIEIIFSTGPFMVSKYSGTFSNSEYSNSAVSRFPHNSMDFWDKFPCYSMWSFSHIIFFFKFSILFSFLQHMSSLSRRLFVVCLFSPFISWPFIAKAQILQPLVISEEQVE